MAIEVTADVTAGEVGETLFGWITLTPDNPAVPAVTMPVAVVPSSGVLPEPSTSRPAATPARQVITGIESIGVTEFTASVARHGAAARRRPAPSPRTRRTATRTTTSPRSAST